MATTLAILTPYSAEFPSSNFPALLTVNARPVLAFDAATAETCYWTLIVPQGLATTMSLIVSYMMASATSGKVDFAAAVEAVSDGDATDLDSGTSFGSDNTIIAPTVPGTAGYIDQLTITLTNDDSIAIGDYVRISLRRDAADATNDTATGDCYILAVELQKA
jgi:hypothetical protein